MRRSIALAALAALTLPASETTILRASVDKLRSGKADLAEVGPDATVRKLLKRPEAANLPWDQKLLASEWLLRAHILTAKAPAPFPAPGNADLLKAWDLVRAARTAANSTVVTGGTQALYRGSDAKSRAAAATALSGAIGTHEVEKAKAKAMDWIALETAVRLQDPALMAEALGAVLERKDNDARDLMLALIAAGHTGRWTDFSDLAQALQGAPQTWAALAGLAQAHPAFFAYTSVSDLVAEAEPKTKSLPGRAAWAIKDMRLSFKDAQSPDAAYAGKARQAFAAPVATGPLDSPVQRVGALAHWRKPGAVALPLSGPADETQLRLRGSLVQTSGGAKVRRTETLDLQRDPAKPGRWTGTQTTQQEVLEGQAPASATYTLVLAVELDLQETPNA